MEVSYEMFDQNNAVATEACDRLTKVIDAFNTLRSGLESQIDDDMEMDGASSLSFVTESPESKTLRDRVDQAEDFLANGPFDGCEESEDNG